MVIEWRFRARGAPKGEEVSKLLRAFNIMHANAPPTKLKVASQEDLRIWWMERELSC